MNEWETFCDTCYFDLWRVRRKDDRGFNDGYHLQNEKEAKALVELLNRIERERNFSRELHALAVESISAWKERAEKAERERDEAINQNAKLRDIAEWFANQFFENDGDERWPSCPVTKKAQSLRATLNQLKGDAK